MLIKGVFSRGRLRAAPRRSRGEDLNIYLKYRPFRAYIVGSTTLRFSWENDMASSKNAKSGSVTNCISLDSFTFDELIEALGGSSRRMRQNAAHELSVRYVANPDELIPFVELLIQSLDLPESRTRWDCLDLLTAIAAKRPELCTDALAGTEIALFDDEGAGPLRLAAVRFLCTFGSTSPERSDRVWGLLDEAIQCYHGDPEYQDMMSALLDFSVADLSDNVKEAFAERMKFDAENNRGLTRTRSQRIIDNLSR